MYDTRGCVEQKIENSSMVIPVKGSKRPADDAIPSMEKEPVEKTNWTALNLLIRVHGLLYFITKTIT